MRWGFFLAALVTLSASPASAQLEPASQADPADQARALELFEEAVALYREGDFTLSATLLREAYALSAEPVLLYNLARALEGDGEFAEAIDAYQRYLDTAGDIPDRGAIDRKLETLRETVAERARLGRFDETVESTPDQPPPVDTAEPEGDGVSPIPWVVAGVGAVGLGVGGILGGLALGAHDAALNAPSQVEADAEQQRARDLAMATNVTLIVSACVLAAGVIWGIIDLTSGPSDESDGVSARLGLGLGTVAVEGEF